MSTEQAAHAGKPAAKLWTRDLVLIILVNLCVFTNHIMSLSTFPFFIQSLGGSEAIAWHLRGSLCLCSRDHQAVCRLVA